MEAIRLENTKRFEEALSAISIGRGEAGYLKFNPRVALQALDGCAAVGIDPFDDRGDVDMSKLTSAQRDSLAAVDALKRMWDEVLEDATDD